MVYECLICGTLHGWIDDPRVVRVPDNQLSLTSMESIWRCPGCGAEHRSTDGTMLGQLHRQYREVNLDDYQPFDHIEVGSYGEPQFYRNGRRVRGPGGWW